MCKYFIINNQSPASNYGIGTYIRHLDNRIKSNVDADVIHIDMQAPVKEFTCMTDEDGVIHLQIPFCLSEDKWYNLCAFYFIAHWIQGKCQGEQLVFHNNYTQYVFLVYLLKETFIASRIVYTVHYQNWCFLLKGNKRKLHMMLEGTFNKAKTDKESLALREQVRNSVRAEIKMLHIADKVIVLSSFTKDILLEEYKIWPEKIVLSPNYVEDTDCHDDSSIESFNDSGKRYLVYVGRLDVNKGVDYLIQAFKLIHEKHPETHLIIVGDGDFSVMKHACSIWEHITFTGKISRDTLNRIYKNSYMGVHLSFNEQCSYTLIEMMKCGLPVIVTDSTGINEMFADIPFCKIHISENRFATGKFINDVCKKAIRLLESPSLYKKISKKTRGVYLSKYASTFMIDKIIKNLVCHDTTPVLQEDMLSELDRNAIDIINNRPEIIDFDFSEISSIGTYLLWRAGCRQISEQQKAILQEHLIYLIDWLDEELPDDGIENDVSCAEMEIFIRHIYKTGFYKIKAERLVRMLLPSAKTQDLSEMRILQHQLRLYNLFLAS